MVNGMTFREVWATDFEFVAPPGERPRPICMVARELNSGRTIRMWEDELRQQPTAPFAIGEDALFVAYYASAELGCFLSLGWALPANVLDLFTEFRNATNGLPTPCGATLLGAAVAFGVEAMSTAQKDTMRELIIAGGPWSAEERAAILDYCGEDTRILAALLERMLTAGAIDLPRALLRGSFMAAAAHMEANGVPVDLPLLEALRENWEALKVALISEIDKDYGVFDGLTFKTDRWAAWLAANGIPWPTTPVGHLALDDDTFRDMARIHPAVAPIRELRHALSQMRLNDLAVGRDGRNRTLLSAFRAKSSRNQPKNSEFIFGPSVWLRSLIRPAPDTALAYLDFEQQEFGIAAALSGDPAMMTAYASGDPYLTFAKQAGAVPADATKESHEAVREQFKSCALGVQYGMEELTLARRLGVAIPFARELLLLHRSTYPRFWRWSDETVDRAMLLGFLRTVYGWRVQLGPMVNPRSLRNFPMQANGAEMLRLSCCFLMGRGVRICAPVHDAVLIEAPLGEIEATVAVAQEAMEDASSEVLRGFRLRTEAKIIRAPDRYADKRGKKMFTAVAALLRKFGRSDVLDHPGDRQ